MAKKNTRKAGGAAGIAVIDETSDDLRHQTNGDEVTANPSSRKAKAKLQQQSPGNFGIGDIKKAAAFANSIGGLDKAIAVLQILKVAKEVQ